MNPRYRPFRIAAIVLIAAWALAFAGTRLAAYLKVTEQKVLSSLRETRLDKLSADDRTKRLRELGDKLNALTGDERRRARMDREWDRLWNEMSEAEKEEFVERTMPTGVKQMLISFEKLPEDKRRFAVTNAIARMRNEEETGGPFAPRPEREQFSEELQHKMITTGLKTFYAESSAQTKVEVAPLLEEMQRMMESGRLFRR